MKKYRRPVEVFFFWLLPLCSIPFCFSFFSRNFSPTFGLCMILLPTLMMYTVVGTGAGYCKFWYFTTVYHIKRVMITIGFVYAAIINIITILLAGFLHSYGAVFILLSGILASLTGTLIDVLLLGTDLLYVKSKTHPRGSDPVKHAFSYGPLFFGTVGLLNGIGIYVIFSLQTVLQTPFQFILAVMLIATLLAAPFVFFFLYQHRKNIHARTI